MAKIFVSNLHSNSRAAKFDPRHFDPLGIHVVLSTFTRTNRDTSTFPSCLVNFQPDTYTHIWIYKYDIISIFTSGK